LQKELIIFPLYIIVLTVNVISFNKFIQISLFEIIFISLRPYLKLLEISPYLLLLRIQSLINKILYGTDLIPKKNFHVKKHVVLLFVLYLLIQIIFFVFENNNNQSLLFKK
jgi:hypothetical protein